MREYINYIWNFERTYLKIPKGLVGKNLGLLKNLGELKNCVDIKNNADIRNKAVKKNKGMITVESALIVPFLFIVISVFISMGIYMLDVAKTYSSLSISTMYAGSSVNTGQNIYGGGYSIEERNESNLYTSESDEYCQNTENAIYDELYGKLVYSKDKDINVDISNGSIVSKIDNISAYSPWTLFNVDSMRSTFEIKYKLADYSDYMRKKYVLEKLKEE